MPDRGVESVVEVSGSASFAAFYAKSRAAEFGLSRENFDAILQEVTKKYLPTEASENDKQQFVANLRIEELALARACAAGRERAWEVFLTRYREKLYGAAAYITKESSAARDLADSLYADLYGTNVREGERVSKLASYTGRGSLEGWLRTVLAQEYINRYRKQRRWVSLDEESEEGTQFAAPSPQAIAVVDPRVEAATDEALAELSAEDRYVLAAYFLDSRTLAEIARVLRVHESTISRKVDKLAKSLRKRIQTGLAQRGMSRQQAQEALDVDVRDLRVNLRATLLQESAPAAFSKKKAEAGRGEDPA
ncbi:MAG TPA: sigma-70 family RNA polymerase sigma factor [Terriglobales bacterium]|jgi:RNA polymerase sigma-70 factor (ECF subfamily)|nr:sigma-70 family RNA polymerase sigma factor [Terriglobales bacterium]